VKGFSIIAKPLTKLTQKDVKFQWANECENSFSTLKNSLVIAPILTLPEPGKCFNASLVGLMCIHARWKFYCLCFQAIENA
jgi:hypothetical protein